MLHRIQGWLKSASGLGVAAACLAGSAYADDENPKVIQLKPNAAGAAVIQALEDGKVTVQIGAAQEGDEEERKPQRKEAEKREGEKRKEGEAKEGRFNVIVRQGEQETGYWIGIHCEPVDEALRAQLSLGEGRGLVIEQVVPDSPAAKAGLKKHDVLIQSGETFLDDVGTLVDLVAKTKDGELKLKIIRGGQAQTITVTPAKRLGEGGFGRGTVVIGQENEEAVKNIIKQLEEQMEKIRKGEGRGELPKFQFLHPGVVLPPGAAVPGQPAPQGWIAMPQIAALPDNMSVTINKSGKNPAKVTVKQGEKTWETTEDKLDSLPAEVRGHVQRMLGRWPMMSPWGSRFGAGARTNADRNPGDSQGNESNPAPKVGEPNPKAQPGDHPGGKRVIELEITPGGELKRSEKRAEEEKPGLEKEAVLRLQNLQRQLQEQAKRMQVRVAGNVEDRLERTVDELHKKFESIEQRLKKLEQQTLMEAKKALQTKKPEAAIIKKLDESIKKLEEKKSGKSDKDGDGEKVEKKSKD